MSSITYEFKASYAFIERNYNIVKRYWAWELVWLVYGIVNSLSVSFIGVGMGGIATIEEYVQAYLQHGLRRVSPFFIPRLIANLAPGQIAIRFGAKGINYAPASACS